MRFLGVWVSFCVERGAGQHWPAGPRPQGGAADRCPCLGFPSIPCTARAARTDWVTRALRNLFTRPGESVLEPFCLPGKSELVRSPFLLLVGEGPRWALVDPSSASAHPPTPALGSFLSPESGPRQAGAAATFARPDFSAAGALSQSVLPTSVRR